MHMILPSNDLADEIAKHKLTHVDREASVLMASKLMRASGATELLGLWPTLVDKELVDPHVTVTVQEVP